MVFIFIALISCTTAFAETKVGPDAARQAHRAEMKSIKEAQRVERAKVKSSNAPSKKEKGFWEKEGERSGLGNTQGIGKTLRNLNPVPFFKNQAEQYKSRKAAVK